MWGAKGKSLVHLRRATTFVARIQSDMMHLTYWEERCGPQRCGNLTLPRNLKLSRLLEIVTVPIIVLLIFLAGT